jgi:hypothetical protein
VHCWGLPLRLRLVLPLRRRLGLHLLHLQQQQQQQAGRQQRRLVHCCQQQCLCPVL